MNKLLRLSSAFLVLYLFILPSNIYAYLDPGTGSYILQIIAAVLFAGLFFIKSWWSKVIGLFKKDDQESSKDTKEK